MTDSLLAKRMSQRSSSRWQTLYIALRPHISPNWAHWYSPTVRIQHPTLISYTFADWSQAVRDREMTFDTHQRIRDNIYNLTIPWFDLARNPESNFHHSHVLLQSGAFITRILWPWYNTFQQRRNYVTLSLAESLIESLDRVNMDSSSHKSNITQWQETTTSLSEVKRFTSYTSKSRPSEKHTICLLSTFLESLAESADQAHRENKEILEKARDLKQQCRMGIAGSCEALHEWLAGGNLWQTIYSWL